MLRENIGLVAYLARQLDFIDHQIGQYESAHAATPFKSIEFDPSTGESVSVTVGDVRSIVLRSLDARREDVALRMRKIGVTNV